ncbi:MAG: hypothetical protein ACOC2W_00815 [bacterium]
MRVKIINNENNSIIVLQRILNDYKILDLDKEDIDKLQKDKRVTIEEIKEFIEEEEIDEILEEE